LPHPDDAGSLTWYFQTGKKPATVIPPLGSSDKDKVRNVVKTVEIAYGSDLDTGEFKKTVVVNGGTPQVTTVPTLPMGAVLGTTTSMSGGVTTTTTFEVKTKPVHIIVCYAGGNGT
jgi:hypothetical protein